MYSKNESDKNLVMLTLAGEQSAYEVLVTRYQRAVISSAMTVTGTQFMAEDAAQDAFVTAWMKLNTLQEPEKYASWVCRIAKNCALNMVCRYRSYIPLDVVDNLGITDEGTENPAELCELSEERDEVNKSIGMLSERVRQIIRLHYFDGLSIAEIADRMRISEGTVKRQLHDGRKRIRKELCAMNEMKDDTLVERVMKKVDELKLWQFKNDKSGFETVYGDVLAEVEKLPECTEKQHALADVLMRGWWWLPGKKNDALFARIADAAMEGKNEEVMTFIVAREDYNVYGGARIDFIRDKQIPRLEKAGFVTALGREWFWLGYYLYCEDRSDESGAAYRKAEEILPRGDACRLLIPYAEKTDRILASDYADKKPGRFLIEAESDEYRYMDGKPRFWSSEMISDGLLKERTAWQVFRNSSRCDGRFIADIVPGETYTGSDGTTLTYVSDKETVETPCGRFDGCQLWTTVFRDDIGKSVFRSYYKDGVGIVRHEHYAYGITEAYNLRSYTVKTADGLLPLDEGNTWEYASEYDPEALNVELSATVSYADANKVVISSWLNVLRRKYDMNSWLDMISQIRGEYYITDDEGYQRINDVYPAIERVERLACTPMEKAHARAAASVARRILSTDPNFNPDHTATGHWNFFTKYAIQKKNGAIRCSHDYRWCFEWKRSSGINYADTALMSNDILGILQDATDCIWSDDWHVGTATTVEYAKWSYNVKTQIRCEDGGTVVTKAGKFDNCLKVCLDIGGMKNGWAYRGGKKVYYFADGIGIVRTESKYGGSQTVVYELTSYDGRGEGYMPIADGLVRRYDAIGLTDGFVGSVEYSYVADDDGDIVIFGDRTGIRELPPPITYYGWILGEQIEQKLCDEGRMKDGQMKYSANNFHLFLHMIARPSHNRNDAKRSIVLQGFFMNMMEQMGENGEVPPAWYGLYAWTAVVKSAALFGDGRKEEGYKALETAVDYCEKCSHYRRGELLDTGKPELLGGVKYEYANQTIVLPDGSKEMIAYDYRMDFNAGNLAVVLNQPHGWEWFNSVRNEDRFKKCAELAGMIEDTE